MKTWIAVILLCAGIALATCTTSTVEQDEVDLLASAAAEATRIIQRAQATAMVLDAQSQATAMVSRSGAQSGTPTGTAEPSRILLVQSTTTSDGQGSPTQTPDTQTVELLGVEVGDEGFFIEVYFRAPPPVVGIWYQGNVSVKNEVTGIVYSEIPVLPVIGPLFGKPVEAGQIGYVMFTNAPVPLTSGVLVTVTLGDFIFEHVTVK